MIISYNVALFNTYQDKKIGQGLDGVKEYFIENPKFESELKKNRGKIQINYEI